MARTTGYTASIALRMIADGLYSYKGISPPEYMGKNPECMKYLLHELKKRDVHWNILSDKNINIKNL
jgi:saccharopine dehydrogenase-like NADP-dependent oxidoreductase